MPYFAIPISWKKTVIVFFFLRYQRGEVLITCSPFVSKLTKNRLMITCEIKVLNSRLHTNSKLYWIGDMEDNLCSFRKSEPETMQHLFYDCFHSISGKISNFIIYFWQTRRCIFSSWRYFNRCLNIRMSLIQLMGV